MIDFEEWILPSAVASIITSLILGTEVTYQNFFGEEI
jgi:hypothetical protein